MIRAPDVCYLFQARDEERLQALVDRWESYGIAAQVVLIPAMEGHHPATDHVNDGRHQTAEMLTQATAQVADTITDAAEKPRLPHSRQFHGWQSHISRGKESLMQNRDDPRPSWDDACVLL
jgi:hypothetical protein